eukprot:gnl/MRDRNA2_/MRDRNA2_98041_c0_seq1.p1 gnl/MRDRNA2_/MRDRNA2_98041_c0~~gnl/MRDRNA2_/MRDRNA2_98041_c0_seq1.p1  ORF type:complete len:779 (+),score=191.57 gnl/MRDRNA2_/MRDRNA2_98041_c0_seq1:139-2475(+)
MGKKKQKAASRAARKASPARAPVCSPRSGSNGKVSTSWHGVQGLTNLGNTCFLNSILQCLNASTYFSNQLLDISGEGLNGLSAAVCQVFTGVRGKKGAFSPKPLLQLLRAAFPWYQGGRQQDAHELLRCLLGSVSDGKTTAEKKDNKPFTPGEPHTRCEKAVWDSFRGHLCALVLCWECKHVSVRLDPFLDLSLEIPGTKSDALSLAYDCCAGATSSADDRRCSLGSVAEGDEEEEDNQEGQQQEDDECEEVTPGRCAAAEVAARNVVSVAVQKVISSVLAQDFTKHLVQRINESMSLGDCNSSKGKPCEFEVILTREGKKGWGFQWDDDLIEEGELVVSGIVEDSVVDKANLKARASGRANEVVSPGDYVIEIKGKTELKEMRKVLKREDSVTITIRKGEPEVEETKKKSKGEGKRCESKSESEKEADRQKLLGDIKDKASNCKSALPPELASVFGGLEPEEKILASARTVVQVAIDDQQEGALDSRWTSALSASLGPLAQSSEKLRNILSAFSWTGTEFEMPPNLKDLLSKLEESPKGCPKEVSLEECMKHFLSTETLEDQYAPSYQCSECEKSSGSKQKSYASRRMLLWPDLPPILTMQLKRFSRHRVSMKFEKAPVEFVLPASFDLSDFLMKERDLEAIRPHLASDVATIDLPVVEANSAKYELYGICVHQGNTMESGHYVAFINKGPSLEQGSWYGASDARIWETTLEKVLKEQAYVAFYRREGLSVPEKADQVAEEKTVDEENEADMMKANADEATDEEGECSDNNEPSTDA